MINIADNQAAGHAKLVSLVLVVQALYIVWIM